MVGSLRVFVLTVVLSASAASFAEGFEITGLKKEVRGTRVTFEVSRNGDFETGYKMQRLGFLTPDAKERTFQLVVVDAIKSGTAGGYSDWYVFDLPEKTSYWFTAFRKDDRGNLVGTGYGEGGKFTTGERPPALVVSTDTEKTGSTITVKCTPNQKSHTAVELRLPGEPPLEVKGDTVDPETWGFPRGPGQDAGTSEAHTFRGLQAGVTYEVTIRAYPHTYLLGIDTGPFVDKRTLTTDAPPIEFDREKPVKITLRPDPFDTTIVWYATQAVDKDEVAWRFGYPGDVEIQHSDHPDFLTIDEGGKKITATIDMGVWSEALNKHFAGKGGAPNDSPTINLSLTKDGVRRDMILQVALSLPSKKEISEAKRDASGDAAKTKIIDTIADVAQAYMKSRETAQATGKPPGGILVDLFGGGDARKLFWTLARSGLTMLAGTS